MWYPWTSDFDRLFSLSDMFRNFDRAVRPETGTQRDPATTLLETPTGYEFRVEVPGAKQEDLSLDIHDQTLTLSAKREIPEREGWSVHRAERRGYAWKHSYSFPSKLDAERTKAKLEHGVLVVNVEKAPENQPRRVRINAT